MIHQVIVPHLGANIDDGRLSQWFKKEGEAVAERDVLCVYETDKAAFDIEAENSGYVLKILHSDTVVPVLTVIGYIGDSPEEPLKGL